MVFVLILSWKDKKLRAIQQMMLLIWSFESCVVIFGGFSRWRFERSPVPLRPLSSCVRFTFYCCFSLNVSHSRHNLWTFHLRLDRLHFLFRRTNVAPPPGLSCYLRVCFVFCFVFSFTHKIIRIFYGDYLVCRRSWIVCSK